jgi:hypothetical protein
MLALTWPYNDHCGLHRLWHSDRIGAVGHRRAVSASQAIATVPLDRDLHEVVFTRKLKPYFSKTDFAVCVRKNDKYRTASGLAFVVKATG